MAFIGKHARRTVHPPLPAGRRQVLRGLLRHLHYVESSRKALVARLRWRTEKLAHIDILDDWYLYGLCVTDIDLVKEYFRHLGDLLGQTPAPVRFREEAVRGIARRFFEFKLDWPFRSPEVNRFGRFYFDGAQHMIRPIDYTALGCERSRFDDIFLSLSNEFRTPEELREEERMIRENITALAAACQGTS